MSFDLEVQHFHYDVLASFFIKEKSSFYWINNISFCIGKASKIITGKTTKGKAREVIL